MRSIVVAAIAAGLLSASTSFPTLAVSGSLPDSVSDGSAVTLEEVRANAVRIFNALGGEDGPISKREFVATELRPGIGPRGGEDRLLERLFGLLDADGDGRLTRTEWMHQIERDLAFADANNDGRITIEELANARDNMGVGEAIGMLF